MVLAPRGRVCFHPIQSIGIFILGRAQLGIVCLIAFLIYKFGTRNTFMDDAIEIFLQSHNLMPIRYSYSQIKIMTNGFKDKLGQGGFGSLQRKASEWLSCSDKIVEQFKSQRARFHE